MKVIPEPSVVVDLLIPQPPVAVPAIEQAFHRCTICNEQVEIAAGSERPSTMLLGASGEANQRVVSFDGIEVHRCPYPAIGRAS